MDTIDDGGLDRRREERKVGGTQEGREEGFEGKKERNRRRKRTAMEEIRF